MLKMMMRASGSFWRMRRQSSSAGQARQIQVDQGDIEFDVEKGGEPGRAVLRLHDLYVRLPFEERPAPRDDNWMVVRRSRTRTG